jgi:catalase
MVSHLLNIDETLANNVAGKLGLKKMPKPADAAVPTRQDLDPSPALSIVENGPERFEGRKLGILVSDGSDAGLLKALKAALDKAGATYEIIAPKVTGVKASDGSWIEADQMIDGGPSVLYDAVALLPAAVAMDDLLKESSARDFVADAFAHCKFIGYVEAALPLFEKSGVAAEDLDEGCFVLGNPKAATSFVAGLAKLRIWGREPNVKMP